MKITAGSLTGRFGKRPRYWAERLLEEGLVHILATDAHNLRNRAPALAEGRDAAAARLGEAEATRMVLIRPRAILDKADPSSVTPPCGLALRQRERRFFPRLFQRELSKGRNYELDG